MENENEVKMTHALKVIIMNYIGASESTRLTMKGIAQEKDLKHAFDLIDLALTRGGIEAVNKLANNLVDSE